MKAKRSLFKDTFLLSFAKPPNTDSSETEEEESANKSVFENNSSDIESNNRSIQMMSSPLKSMCSKRSARNSSRKTNWKDWIQ